MISHRDIAGQMMAAVTGSGKAIPVDGFGRLGTQQPLITTCGSRRDNASSCRLHTYTHTHHTPLPPALAPPTPSAHWQQPASAHGTPLHVHTSQRIVSNLQHCLPPPPPVRRADHHGCCEHAKTDRLATRVCAGNTHNTLSRFFARSEILSTLSLHGSLELLDISLGLLMICVTEWTWDSVSWSWQMRRRSPLTAPYVHQIPETTDTATTSWRKERHGL